MENKKYFIAIGYPMGLVEAEEKTFMIEQKEISYTVQSIDYLVWQLALEITDSEMMLDKFKEITKLGEEEFNFIVNRLLEKKLLIKVENTTIQETYLLFKDMSFDKQGNGIGYSQNEDGINNYSVELKDEIKMSFFEYFIWSSGNGRKVIDEIVNDGMELMNSDKESVIGEFIPSLIFLYQSNLLYFKG